MKILKILTTIMLLSVACVSAEVPKLINYSGKLMDKTDHIVADKTYDMRFGLWDAASGGNKIWEENHLVAAGNGVPVARGSFSTFIGSVNPTGNPMPKFEKNYYMEFAFKTESSAAWEVFPRQQIVSVAYAMRAERANSADTATAAANSYKLEGIGASGFIMKNVHAVTNADLASDSVDQDKARFAPVAWKYPGMSGTYPKIVYGQTTSGSNGGFTIDITSYNFSEAPIFTGTIQANVVGFVIGNATRTTVSGSTHNKDGVPVAVTFNWILVGR